MSLFKHTFLLIGIILPTMFCHTMSMQNSENDGTSIVVIAKTCHSTFDKSTYINASISGHTLTVVFSQNLGDVDVEVLSTSGNFMHNAVDELEVKS